MVTLETQMLCSTCQVDKPEDALRPTRRRDPDKYVQSTRQCLDCYRDKRAEGQRRRRAAAEKLTERTCARCGVTKAVEQFTPHRPYCRECRAAWQRDYVDRNRGKAYAAARKWRRENNYAERKRLGTYGLTPDDYQRMFKEQGGVCYLCKRPQSKGRKNLSVDHDHRTGRVRALLCTRCNVGLAQFDDNVEVMAAAIAYVEEHR